MDNNSKGIIKIVLGTFSLFIGLTFNSTDVTGLAILFFAVAFCAITWGCWDIGNSKKQNDDSSSIYFSEQEKKDLASLNKAAEELHQSIRYLSDAYMLNIPDEAIRGMIYSENPFLAFSKYVPDEYPAVCAFCMNVIAKCEELIEKMNLPLSSAGPLYEYCLSFTSELADALSYEDIIDIAEENAKGLPEKLSCLHTQINYETSALGVIAEYAIKNHDSRLIKKVNDYRRSRGYIN